MFNHRTSSTLRCLSSVLFIAATAAGCDHSEFSDDLEFNHAEPDSAESEPEPEPEPGIGVPSGASDLTQGTSTTQALPGGIKVCSVVTPGQWRTDMVVPHGWRNDDCEAFRSHTIGSFYQLGCLYDWGFSFGTPNGGLPPQDCGWQPPQCECEVIDGNEYCSC